MKKTFLQISALFIISLLVSACEDRQIFWSEEYYGVWNMNDEEEGELQQKIELKADQNFTETWTYYDEDGSLLGELTINGKYYKDEVKKGQLTVNAMSRVYDLESLSDSNGVLEMLEEQNYFKEMNDDYESAKKEDKVYGLVDFHMTDNNRIIYDGGAWTRIDTSKPLEVVEP